MSGRNLSNRSSSKEDAELPEDDYVTEFEEVVTDKNTWKNTSQEAAELPEDDLVTGFDKVNGCNALQLDFMKRLISNTKYTVMVSGKSRMGKSTALNNLLGLKLPARLSPVSVTQQVVMESTTSQEGVHVCGIDTPGLQATDIDKKKVMKDMRKKVGIDVENFTLLYCMSASTNLDVADDPKIMKDLTQLFGADIWKRCTLVLTFCDEARSQRFQSDDKNGEYKQYLRDYAEAFRGALANCISDAPAVKVILDCEVVESTDNDKMTELKVPPDTIVAVPAAVTKEEGRKHNILPGFNIGGNIDWTEYALCEVMRRSGRFTPPEIKEIKEKYNLSTLAADAAIGLAVAAGGGAVVGGTGAGIGAGIGAIVGVAGGPPGVAVGAVIGAAVGSGLGAISSLGTYIWYRNRK